MAGLASRSIRCVKARLKSGQLRVATDAFQRRTILLLFIAKDHADRESSERDYSLLNRSCFGNAGGGIFMEIGNMG